MKRIHLIVAAAIAAAALIGPQAAFAGKAHYLGMYKVEKHIDIQGEDETYTISCHSGDIALDGMWRLDNVDQDNDYQPLAPPGFDTTGNSGFDVLESVLPVAAYATAVDTYTFQFLPLGGGDAQAKLFLTCLPDPTPSVSGHGHHWNVFPSPPVTHALGSSGSFTDATPCSFTPTPSIAVAPGFQFMTSSGAGSGWGTPYKRWPSSSSTVAGWSWGFDVDGPAVIDTSYHCLEIKSANAGSPPHAHKIVKAFAPKTPPGTSFLLKKKRVQEIQVHCGELYKGMIGAWDFGTFYGYKKLWYLGMDPRPKTRAFKILNADISNDYNADFGLVCFKDKTT
jgi:hypothetical protein